MGISSNAHQDSVKLSLPVRKLYAGMELMTVSKTYKIIEVTKTEIAVQERSRRIQVLKRSDVFLAMGMGIMKAKDNR